MKVPAGRAESAAVPAAGEDAQRLPEDLLALTHLDAADGVRRIGGRASSYRRQLRRFRAQYEDAIAGMRRHLAQSDLDAAESHCHMLKGVAGNIGARALFACVSQIDAVLKQGRAPDDAALDLAQVLLGDVLADIDSLDEDMPDGDRPAAPLAAAAVRELLARLRQAIESDLGAAEPLLDELRQGVAGTPLLSHVEDIAARLDRFDLDAALALMEKLPVPPESVS